LADAALSRTYHRAFDAGQILQNSLIASMKKRLLVILGAGTSVSLGMPSLGQLNKKMEDWAKDWSATQTHGINYYQRITENRKHVEQEPNFENLLADMHSLINSFPFWGSEIAPPKAPDPVLMWFRAADVFADLNIWPNIGRDNPRSEIIDQLDFLYVKLADFFRTACIEFNKSGLDDPRHPFQLYKRFFTFLREHFDIGIYNLNYDSLADTATTGLFTGFDNDTGVFLPSVIAHRQEWSFIYHIHGSVHFTFKDVSIMTETVFYLRPEQEIIWQKDLSMGEFSYTNGSRSRSEGRSFQAASLVAGGWKLEQIQSEPFLSLYSQFPRHVSEADAILVAGYGFADSHINSVLHNYLHRLDTEKRPPILVIDFAVDRERLPKRFDSWANTMTHTFDTVNSGFRHMGYHVDEGDIPDELRPTDTEFIVSPPIAVWCGGFNNPYVPFSEFWSWLNGDPYAFPLL
jgi:hypothetical protein